MFDGMIADVTSNKKLHISLMFITQSYFPVPKDVRLNTTNFFIMKILKSGRFNKLLLVIHLILTPKTSCRYTENALQKIFGFSH